MSEAPPNTPKREAIVKRLRQRIDSFRKRHDSCVARLEETQQSRDLKQLQESRIFQSKILDKGRMNGRIRSIKQDDSDCKPNVSSVNTILQSKRKFTQSTEPERANDDDIPTPVSQKYTRFDKQNDSHCNVKTKFIPSQDCEQHMSANTIPYSPVNGHSSDVVTKRDEMSNNTSSYNNPSCKSVDQAMARDFTTSTFSQQHSQLGDKSSPSDFTVNFKQDNGCANNEAKCNATSALLPPISSKTDENFRLLTDIEGSNTAVGNGKPDDLAKQLSQFERVLQGIKSRDENDMTSSSDVGKNTGLLPQTIGNGLGDTHETKVNQLNIPKDNNADLQTSSGQQYGISRTTAQALQQLVMAHQNGRPSSKIRLDGNVYPHPDGDQNNSQMTTAPPSQQASPFPVRQRVLQQLQHRRHLHLQRQIAGAAPQGLQARNPVMTQLTRNPMHSARRFSGVTSTVQQGVMSPLSHAAGRIPQNMLMRQPMQQAQMTNLPRHPINLIAQQPQQQQRPAFQQQLSSRPPSYSQAHHLTRSSVTDPKGGITSTIVNQYNTIQSNRAPQGLSHLQHYNPPGYGNQSAPPNRPVRFSADYPDYQYQYGQENKLHPYQRHSSLDDNLVRNRFHAPDMNQRNNFAFQRSSSVPGHPANNLYNQSSAPVVRLDQNNPNIPDMNNNAHEHTAGQDINRVHVTQTSLSHIKQRITGQPNNIAGMNPEQLYQGNNNMAQSRSQASADLQAPLSNSFSDLLDMNSNSDTSLFPFLGQDLASAPSDNTEFSSRADFDLLNMLDEPSKSLQ